MNLLHEDEEEKTTINNKKHDDIVSEICEKLIKQGIHPDEIALFSYEEMLDRVID